MEEAMRIVDIMTRGVHACRLGQTLNDAAELMWDRDIGCVPVVNHDGYVVGMLTDRDVCMGAYTTGRSLREVPVETALARKVIACRSFDTVGSAEKLMREHLIRRLAVLDDAGRLIGIVALGDIARHITPSFGGRADGLGAEAIAYTLAAGSDPPAPPPG
jgi:CBS domain-containing protein